MKTGTSLRIVLCTALTAALLALLLGCQPSAKYSARQEAKYVKPTIAVMGFENRAAAHMKWNLGEGLADQLIDRLIQTRRYVVLEREHLDKIFTELKRSKDKRFRKTGTPQPGRLKHVQYLIKGTITDFGHVETVEGFWRLLDWGLLGASSYSIVAATIYVTDVQTGQVIASKSVEAKVRDEKDEEEVTLDGMTFGSYTFYQTSIGRATEKMLDRAVHAIAQTVAERPFQPKIASIVNNQIIISGGKDRRIKVGAEYLVRPASQTVTDPDTGDILSHVVGRSIGRVRISHVAKKYAIAEVLQGDAFKVGQTLFAVKPQAKRSGPAGAATPPPAASPSSY